MTPSFTLLPTINGADVFNGIIALVCAGALYLACHYVSEWWVRR